MKKTNDISKKPSSEKFFFIFIILLLLSITFAILIHAYFGYFSRYIADDYCNAGTAKTLGFFIAQSSFWNNWDGRYSSNFFKTLFGLWGDKAVSYIPTVSILFLLISSYYFVKQITKRILSQTKWYFQLLLSMLFVFFVIYSIPQVAEDFYWFDGLTSYQIPIILEFFILGLAIKLIPEMGSLSRGRQIVYPVILFILSFINSGFAEIFTAIHVAFWGIVFIAGISYQIKSHKKVRALFSLGLLFLGALLGLVAVALAPGNTVRGGALISSTHPGLIETLLNGAVNSLKYSLTWSMNQSKIIWPVCMLLIVLILSLPQSSKEKETPLFSNNLYFVLYLLILAFLIFVSFVPTYYTGKRIPPDRGLIFAVILLCAIFFSCSLFFGFKLRQYIHYDEIKGISTITVLFCVVALCFSISIPLNLARHYYFDNFPAQFDYATNWDKSNAEILEGVGKGEKEIVTTKIKYGLADLETITNEPAFWVNQCAAEYYGVDTIIAQ